VIALLRKFTSLDRSTRILVLEAAAVMALVWTGLRLARLPTLRRILDRYAGSSTAGNPRQPDAIAPVCRAITQVAARVPSWTCLVQALAADAILRQRGLTCELRIGVRVRRDRPAALQAHAWVECHGEVAIGAVEDLSDFKVLMALRSS
jgi:hypothetical protein